MSIQWYPGHMHKASNEMIEALPLVNVVVEVLDARIPFSSSNPFIQGLCTDKPRIKILNKCDLADPGDHSGSGRIITSSKTTPKPWRWICSILIRANR